MSRGRAHCRDAPSRAAVQRACSDAVHRVRAHPLRTPPPGPPPAPGRLEVPPLPQDESAAQTQRMIMQIWISIFSMIIALIPSMTILSLFSRKVHREYVPRRVRII